MYLGQVTTVTSHLEPCTAVVHSESGFCYVTKSRGYQSFEALHCSSFRQCSFIMYLGQETTVIWALNCSSFWADVFIMYLGQVATSHMGPWTAIHSGRDNPSLEAWLLFLPVPWRPGSRLPRVCRRGFEVCVWRGGLPHAPDGLQGMHPSTNKIMKDVPKYAGI